MRESDAAAIGELMGGFLRAVSFEPWSAAGLWRLAGSVRSRCQADQE